ARRRAPRPLERARGDRTGAAREGAARRGAPASRGAARIPARRPSRPRARARILAGPGHGARRVRARCGRRRLRHRGIVTEHGARSEERMPKPLRILMLNAFFWLKGGVERTMFDETRWLGAAGHEVAHFAIADARNRPSPFARHFAPAADFGEETPAWRQ